ncbi:hypothetical protein FQA39_LY00215 [Lamprigera yunnana]|nr:hypothetical protein FQA39_LY00215 [Lamprigera yunnana]
MELDLVSPDSDEGVDLSPIIHNSEVDLTINYALEDEKHLPFLEADTVYVLLPKNVRVSRAARFQWLLDHLNTIISVPPRLSLDASSTDLEVISIVPRQHELAYTNKYMITSSTNVKYLAYSYRFVCCVDMSPSQSAVDIQKGEILFDKIIRCIKITVENLILQFTVPGNSLVFQPNLYLTVIVNTPFYMSPAQQVLVEGVVITEKNIQEILQLIEDQFNFLEGRIAHVSAMLHDEIESQQAEGRCTDTFVQLNNGHNLSNIPLVLPDANFVNMLRYSMLAISLLPENSLSHILVITDGVVAMPDGNIMETLLMQLHYDSIAVSFLKVGSSFHPHNSAGYISYTDLLKFLSQATLGVYLEEVSVIIPEPFLWMNMYQELFLLWTFQSKIDHDLIATQSKPILSNKTFDKKVPILLCKRQTAENINASSDLLFSRRMREGYNVDRIKYNDNCLHVSLALQWKTFIYIQYHMYYQWPIVKNLVQVEVHIIAPYEFLHDITCIMRKEPKSTYRQAVIERFWLRLSQLTSGDTFLIQQLSVMPNSTIWYMLPDSVKSGIPVFILNGHETSKVTLTPSDVSCSKFLSLWQPICQIETTNWRKWFHTYKLSVVLKYDHPLPKHLQLANPSGRYQVIQCRQAATALYGLLSEWSSFVLIDNHTYVKLISQDLDKPPSWFCLIRITSKLPCAIINLAFITGTPGAVRRKVYQELQIELSLLSYLSSPLKSKENLCCTLLKKPLERVLIRYERIPKDFSTVIFPDGTQPGKTVRYYPSLVGSLFTTLSRYLYHKRWIWSTSHVVNPKLELSAVSRILSTLTRMRIKEGFSFAHSSSGIITMVMEVPMVPVSTCLIQYVVFPPHRAWRESEFVNGSEEDVDPESESDSELQMVTEVWVEPQYGSVCLSDAQSSHFHNKCYYELAEVIFSLDSQCISSLLTLEHLTVICQNKSCSSSCDIGKPQSRLNISNRVRRSSNQRNNSNGFIEKICDIKERIQHVPFNFDPISILSLCQQTELLFSMFVESDKINQLHQCDHEESNKLLLENLRDHLQCLHDYEFDVTPEESERLMNQILHRHQDESTHTCPLSIKAFNLSDLSLDWRCYIKGISVTHVVLTFVPSTLNTLKKLVCMGGKYTLSLIESSESTERASSRGSNFSDVPINVVNSLILPLYVFDCPLALLVDAYVNNSNEDFKVNGDIYEDHRFKYGFHTQEDSVRLKSDEDPGHDDPDADSKYSIKSYCKALVLTHSKCFVMSLFSTLQNGSYVHSSDVLFAMDQCEETLYDIDISYYMRTVCGHMKENDEQVNVEFLHQPLLCNELKPLHHIIKERFSDIMNMAFSPIPTNRDFYYCHNLTIDKSTLKDDSDDEISIPPSDGVEFRSDKDASSCSETPLNFMRLDSTNSIFQSSMIAPLFVHLICTVRYNNNVGNICVKLLPTCLGELIQSIEPHIQFLEKSNLQITLDILCLTLPITVQNVINDYSAKGLRTTSFCSDGFPPSVDSATSDTSIAVEFSDPIIHLPEVQRKAISNLNEKIKWLLKDEIATALLDIDIVTPETLSFVMNHVSDNVGCSSCVLDIIDLNFVYGSSHSYDKFVQEFAKITIPHYKLCKEKNIYYLAKSTPYGVSQVDKFAITELISENFLIDLCIDNVEKLNSVDSLSEKSDPVDLVEASEDNSNRNEVLSQHSDVSSTNESYFGSDGGYDEDISEDEEDYNWLIRLEKKRQNLPNFWLIMFVNKETVTIYFHCRFLELPTTHVGIYLQVQRTVRDAIRDLCKRVNQSLLLQALNDTRTCNFLLEPDDNWNINVGTATLNGSSSLSRLKSMDETSDESDPYPTALLETSSKFTAGFFSCPVVWETQFALHPRLKTGFGKSGYSKGVLALKTVLDKFSVSNRNNMFVYQDVNSNVFYLRLHENVQSYCGKSAIRSNEFESTMVTRSPSIASLPLGPQKNSLTQSQHSIVSSNSRESDVRPRVRSFGEKETKDNLGEDTLILKVHGITEAGKDVQCDLVQVLQNRLDDAVLECLSIMLARNAMCPLTPEDVHFLQKPFRLPESVIRLSMQKYALKYLGSFIHYLRQNLLQFLNVPKYTDNRSHYHFKDYSETEQTMKFQENIFIYNQSQNPSSGNRGIACIALAIISRPDDEAVKFDGDFSVLFKTKKFEELVYAKRYKDTEKPSSTYVEFRLWKQGRVNTDNLTHKLCAATKQSMWDIVMEYYLLQSPLCTQEVDRTINEQDHCDTSQMMSTEVECNVILTTNIVTCTKTRRKHHTKSAKTVETPKVFISQRHKNYIPLNSNVRRSILFEDYLENQDQLKSDDKKKSSPKFDSFELGNEGVLTTICSKVLHKWLEFGVELCVPAVRKSSVVLSSPHMLNTTVQEFRNVIAHFSHDSTKAFVLLPNNNGDKQYCEEIYVPYNNKHFPSKAIIVSRNLEQWKACMTSNSIQDYCEMINFQNLKHMQKFVPSVSDEFKFVPRQRFLWTTIDSTKIYLYTYNWSKDNINKLIDLGEHIGLWLSVRAAVLNSITAQKLGIFYNQALTRNSLDGKNPYLNYIGDVEFMMKFSRDYNRRFPNTAIIQPMVTLEAFWDVYPSLQTCHNDPVVLFTLEMHDMKHNDKKHKEELRKLHSMWQSRTSSCTLTQIQILKQNSRTIHFCHTPLLFLPCWRVQSASTRDNALSPSLISISSSSIDNGTLMKSEEALWHNALCQGFISEYKRYLETLGFIPLQIESAYRKKGTLVKVASAPTNSVFYVQKAMLGGILIFSIHLKEPFFITKLHAIECNRLRSNNYQFVKNQFTLNFLDETDQIKMVMHLHSFTYDFHLRCIRNYVGGINSVEKVCEGYHLIHFLDDFMKYYNKAPNFARNLVHEEKITISELTTEEKQLYDYLLSNVNQYGMDVFSTKGDDGECREYVLVQMANTPQMSYKDFQDCQHTDDFDVTLVLSRLPPEVESNIALHLQYYLILTSRREVFPKAEGDRKLGKFRTVSAALRLIPSQRKGNMEDDNNSTIGSQSGSDIDYENSTEQTSVDIQSDSTSQQLDVDSQKNFRKYSVNPLHIEIKQESVNYLGYFSSHERLMQQLILEQAAITRNKIRKIVSQGMVDCRTHLLWNKLVSPPETNQLTYGEFVELKNLARLESLSDTHPNLTCLLHQPLTWYQGLAKLLLVKYIDQNRTFISPDANIQHYVILHHRYDGAFMLLSIDLHTSRGMSYRNDDYKEFGGRSSRRRTDDRSRYDDIDDHRNLERGSPKQVIPLGSYIYTCQDEIICKVETDDVPFFNAPIYLENKEQIGTIVKILGNPKDYSVTIRLSENVDVSSFKKNQKLFIDPDKLLTSQRFLPRPHRSPNMRRSNMAQYTSRTIKILEIVTENIKLYKMKMTILMTIIGIVQIDQQFETMYKNNSYHSDLLILDTPEVTNNLQFNDSINISNNILVSVGNENTLTNIFQDISEEIEDTVNNPNLNISDIKNDVIKTEDFDKDFSLNDTNNNSDTENESDDESNLDIQKEGEATEHSSLRKKQNRHLVNANSWKQNVKKQKREKGEEYFGKTMFGTIISNKNRGE